MRRRLGAAGTVPPRAPLRGQAAGAPRPLPLAPLALRGGSRAGPRRVRTRPPLGDPSPAAGDERRGRRAAFRVQVLWGRGVCPPGFLKAIPQRKGDFPSGNLPGIGQAGSDFRG